MNDTQRSGESHMIRWAAAVGVAVLLLASLALWRTRALAPQPDPFQGSVYALSQAGGQGPEARPAGLLVSPSGAEVSRLEPIRVTYPVRLTGHAGADLLKLEPQTPGQYAWLDDRTLQFQPDFPGLLRGRDYTIQVTRVLETGVPDDYRQTFTTAERLTVDQVVPQDEDQEIPLEAQILVQFSRGVAPLTTLSEQPSGPVLVSEPPLAGRGEWLNTSLYRLIPENLQPFTRYELRVPASLSAQPDGVLQEDFRWSFTTVGPAIAGVSPQADAVNVGPDATVEVQFTQPMQRSSAEAGITVMQNGEIVSGAFTWSEDAAVVTFTGNARLRLGASYEVVVAADLPGLNGGRTRNAWRSEFSVVGAPAIGKTTPADGERIAPRYGISLQFTNPMDRDSVEERVSVSGIDADTILLFWSNDLNLFLNTPLKPSTTYTVTIDAGAVDRYGQTMPQQEFAFSTGALAPTVSLVLPTSPATYSASTDPLLYFNATNVPSVTFALHPLNEDEIRRAQSGTLPRPFTPSLDALRTWTERPAGEVNEAVFASTSVSGGGPLGLGDYCVTVTFAGQSAVSPVFAFSVVNSTLIAKMSQDELLVWALDHDSGAPLNGVVLHADARGVLENTQRTDSDGIASFRYRPDPTRPSPVIVTLDDGPHRGVVVGTWQQGAQPWELNVPLEYSTRSFVGYAYTDRPIYRPGEDVQFKGVIRVDDDINYRVPQGTSFPLAILDPTGKRLHDETVSLNEFGSFAGTLSLPPDAAIGDYRLTIADSPNPLYGFIATATFLVAEFRKPEFEVTVATDLPAYADGDRIDISGRATFFFGGPLAGAPVTWAVQMSPIVLRSPAFPNYSFADDDRYRQAVVGNRVAGQSVGVTDAGGRMNVSVPASITGNQGAQTYEISATVTDENAQAVSANTSVTVHPAALYAGLRLPRYLATAGAPATLLLATVDTTGAPLPSRPVTVQVYERRWVTSKEQASDGSRRYRSDPEDTLVATLETVTDAEAKATLTYVPSRSGTLRLVAEATDDQGRTARASTSLWVTSSEYAPWQVGNSDVLPLVADKDEYHLGDVAEILVPSPYPGMRGLVTVERGKIISRELVTFTGNSEVVSIPIVAAHVPDVFVTVVLYRAPTDVDPVPRYKLGYVKLPVSTETRQLRVEVQPDRPQAGPGATVKYTMKVTDLAGKPVRSELSVAVVDKAVLSLAEERTPTGLKAFWLERGLSVRTASSMAASMDRSNNAVAELGDAGNKGGSGQNDERLRQDFRNTAFWRAQLPTDDQGMATVDVRLPDDLTTWRIQVRAITADTMVGEGIGELLSTQPLLIRPALPRFLRVGDEVTLRAIVQNGTAAAMQVQLDLAAEGIELIGSNAPTQTRSVAVSASGSTLMEWPARVPADGDVKLTFTASGAGGLRDAVERKLVAYPSLTGETTATGGVVLDEPRTEQVYLPTYATLQGGRLAIAVQPSLVGSLEGELKPLQPKSWDSNVTIAARLIATAGVRLAVPSIAATGQIGSNDALNRDVTRLTAAQQSDGGWSWCSSAPCKSDPVVTGWVLLALGEARREGRALSPDLGDRAATYLNSYLNQPRDVLDPQTPDERAFLLYALAAVGSPQPGLVTALEEQSRASLEPWGKAYLALALMEQGVQPSEPRLQAVLADLDAAVVPSANGNHWETTTGSRAFHTSTSATALVLAVLVRARPDHPLIEETVRWLAVGRGAGGWNTPIERGQALVALSNYLAHTQELHGNYSYAVQLNGSQILGSRFDASASPTPSPLDLPLSRLTLGGRNLLTFMRDFTEPGRLYYTLALRYMTPARQIEALNRGVAVSHEYSLLDDPTTPVDHARLGDTVRVKVTVVNQHDLKYVEVNDLLPAGLEAVDPRLKTTDPAQLAQLEEERRQAGPVQTRGFFRAPWYRGYYSPWQQVQVRDDRVTLSATTLNAGVTEYVYYARATAVGAFFVPPAQAEQTNFPEVFGRGDSSTFAVAP